jgi:hypothetical protein|nr:MAG TPA: hypothetical protein [Caudoviricetes sp.]
MHYKRLNAEDAFAEIARLEREHEDGVVVNIAEKYWVGSAPDDAFGDTVREYDMPVFHSDYRLGMVDIVFPGDLCICVVEKNRSRAGDRILRAACDYLTARGIPAGVNGSDFLIMDIVARKLYKIGSYGDLPVNGMWEATVHISIHADMELIEACRDEPPEMTRIGLDRYGVTAEELLAAIAGEIKEDVTWRRR